MEDNFRAVSMQLSIWLRQANRSSLSSTSSSSGISLFGGSAKKQVGRERGGGKRKRGGGEGKRRGGGGGGGGEGKREGEGRGRTAVLFCIAVVLLSRFCLFVAAASSEGD